MISISLSECRFFPSHFGELKSYEVSDIFVLWSNNDILPATPSRGSTDDTTAYTKTKFDKYLLLKDFESFPIGNTRMLSSDTFVIVNASISCLIIERDSNIPVVTVMLVTLSRW